MGNDDGEFQKLEEAIPHSVKIGLIYYYNESEATFTLS